MALNNALNASTAGIVAITSAGVIHGRTITGTSNQIALADGDGAAANPTYSLTSTIYVSGISFNSGTTTLANYSTGTFSPGVDGSTGSPTVTYTAQVGRYTRIGNRVFTMSYFQINTFSGGSGLTRITNQPITSTNVTNLNDEWSPWFETVTFAASSYYIVQLPPNDTLLRCQAESSGATSASLPITAWVANSKFYATMIYEV